MATYFATTRSNYFRVKDAKAFEAWCDRDLEFWKQSFTDMRNAYAISSGNETGWPYHDSTDEEEDEEIDFTTELATHLNPRDIAVLLEIGFEKLRYFVGVATAVRADGHTVCVDLEEIYQRAAEQLGGDHKITDATY